MTWKALDLFCCAGGMSEGLRQAGFEVTGVDIRDLAKYHRGGRFVQGEALTYSLDGFDYVHASPPCQSHSCLRHLHPGKEYPDLIEAVRERLRAWGGPWSIENVPGAPLGGANLVVLCGTMFGLQTPDGRAEIRRHRLFELSFCPDRQPPRCWHGGGADAETGQGHLFGPQTAIGVTGTGSPVAGRSTQREVLTVTGTHGLPGLGAREMARRQVLGVYGGEPQLAQHRTRDRKRMEALSVTGNGLDSNRERWPRRSLSVTGHAIEISPTNWPEKRVICVVGGKAMSGGMSEPQGLRKRRAMSVTGQTPQTNVERNISRETFSVDDARAAMGIDWMPMKYLSQAILPVYGRWVGEQAIRYLERLHS